MTKIYLYRDPGGVCRMEADGEGGHSAAMHSGCAVYAIDVEEHVPTPPKKDRWTVMDRDGDALSAESFRDVGCHTDYAVSYAYESDAILLKDTLELGGMTGLSVRKIEESE